MRYRDGPLVLKNFSVVIPGGSSVGIAGRTGSGKSSLMVSLFRIAPLAQVDTHPLIRSFDTPIHTSFESLSYTLIHSSTNIPTHTPFYPPSHIPFDIPSHPSTNTPSVFHTTSLVQGRILIDGVDIHKIPLAALRYHIITP